MPLLIRWILQAGVPGDQSRQTQREAGKTISRPYQFFPPFRQINSFRMVLWIETLGVWHSGNHGGVHDRPDGDAALLHPRDPQREPRPRPGGAATRRGGRLLIDRRRFDSIGVRACWMDGHRHCAKVKTQTYARKGVTSIQTGAMHACLSRFTRELWFVL